MNRVVLDADVFIDYLKGKSKNFLLLVKKAKKKEIKLFVPTAVLVEIFVGYEFLQNQVLKDAQKLLREIQSVPLTEEIASLAAKLGREKKLGFLGTVDLVLAATALVLDAQIATHNVKHFRLIPEVKIFDFESLTETVS